MSETISSTVVETAPSLIGVWVFDPTSPDSSERNFPYADGRTEDLVPVASSVRLAGRVDPLLEFGTGTTVALKLTVLIPFDADHDALVQWWRDAAEARRALCYRDNRSRLYWVGLPAGISMTDGRIGTAFSLQLQRVGYDEAV